MRSVAARHAAMVWMSAACVVGAGVGACGGTVNQPAGVSAATGGGHSRSTKGADGGAPEPAALAILPKDFRARYSKLSSARFVSAGHASGRFEVEVYANDSAREAFPRQSGTFPVGAVLVKEHWERGPGRTANQPGPLMAMEKMASGFDAEHGDWRYVVVGPSGEVLEDGKPDGCVLCHDDAPHDHVFLVR